jgi:flagellar hook protein FlgE
MALTSLFTAVSGMNANGLALSVIGDNVANMNTAGFKASKTAFGDILAAQVGAGQVGRGVMLNSVAPQFSQGTFESTANVLDLAVDGDGLFVVEDSSGTFYTRAGQFHSDKNGYVINTGGQRLQGYLYSASGTATSGVGDINISSLNSSPTQTSTVTMTANLDSRVVIPAAFDVTDPNNTSNFSSSVTAYDTLGNGHIVNLYFRKSAEAATGNTWEYKAVVGASDTTSGIAEIQAEGTLGFDNNGRLDTESAITYPTGGFDFNGSAAQDQTIGFDFGNSITTEGGSGLDGTTQFGATSATMFQTQDGYSSGSMKSITIDQDGKVTGVFTNGQTRTISQIALARFMSPSDLTKMGRNLYAESTESGQPIINIPGASGIGTVLSSTLEQSNVDLAEEFVKMIMSQRGFQANSRMISTSDELMMEVVNLKR